MMGDIYWADEATYRKAFFQMHSAVDSVMETFWGYGQKEDAKGAVEALCKI